MRCFLLIVTKSKENTKTSLIHQFLNAKKTKNLIFHNISSVLVYLLFFCHVFIFDIKQYKEYQVITLNRELRSGPTKKLPRISICPYYKLEDPAYYYWNTVWDQAEYLSNKYGIPNWVIMPGRQNPESAQSLFLNLDKNCMTSECQCDLQSHSPMSKYRWKHESFQQMKNLNCSLPTRGCEWMKSKNTTITGKTCQKWLMPINEYIHLPNKYIMEWAIREGITGNRCMDADLDTYGPWCYT